MKKAAFIVAIAVLLFVPTVSIADPTYRIIKESIACEGPKSDENLFNAQQNTDELPSGCYKLPENYQFEAMNRSIQYIPRGAKTGIKLIYGRDINPDPKIGYRYFTIMASDAEPVLDSSGKMLPAPPNYWDKRPEQPKPTAQCPSGIFVHIEKLRARGVRVIKLSLAAQKNVIRYLDKTQGQPPDLSNIHGYTMYLVEDPSETGYKQDGVYHITPPSGAIAIIKDTCLLYRIDGTNPTLDRIVSGTWSLSSH
jgi:hypothetical protein